MRSRTLALLLLVSLLLPGVGARAAGLVADLSNHLIAITTAFSGTDVLVFGTIEHPGSDVIIVVRGPPVEQTIRRKSKIGFIWLNTDRATFAGVPDYYAVAASRPLADITDEQELERYEIGLGRIRFQTAPGTSLSPEELKAYADSLVRRKAATGLFQERVAKVTFLGELLFRTTLTFPADVPPGTYQVLTHEVRDGIVIGAQSSALVVSKVGLEASVSSFARQQAALYGVAAIAIAVVAGWTASLIFGKR